MRGNARFIWLAVMLAVDIGCAARTPVTQAPAPAPAPPPPMVAAPLQELPAIQIEQREVAQAPRQLYSIEVTDTEIRDVLLTLGKSTDLSFVIGPGVEGMITVNLKQVTLEEMLDSMLTPIGLTFQREGGVIRVERPRVQTRVFSVNYIASQRSGTSGLSSTSGASGGGGGTAGAAGGAGAAAGGGGAGGGSTSNVGSTDTFDLWGELEGTLEQFLSENGRLIMSPTAGLVAVTDLPENVMQVARYLDLVQGSVQRQVMIEAQILEITLNEESRAGVDWSQIPQRLTLPGVGAVTGTLPGGAILSQVAGAASSVFQFGLSTQTGLRLLLSALETQGTVSILSSPKVSTLNNQKAIIKVATDDVFFTQTTQREPLTGVVTQTVTPNTITEGLVLDVTPQIGEDAITMNIRPSISERLGERVSPQGDTVPILAVRASDTVVRVRDGETVVIGGLMQQRTSKSRSGVPGLQRVPLAGRAFRSDTETETKVELVILLTPTVIVGRGDTELTPRELQLLREAGSGFSRR